VHLIVREIRSFLFNKLLRFFNRLCYGTIRFDGHPEHLPQLPNITLGSSRIVKSERDVAEVSSFIKWNLFFTHGACVQWKSSYWTLSERKYLEHKIFSYASRILTGNECVSSMWHISASWREPLPAPSLDTVWL
jgi:hypothetical protein